MLITQEYTSLQDIDFDYINSIEMLLASTTIDFNHLIELNNFSPNSEKKYFYLFFCHQHNKPIGICQFTISPIPRGMKNPIKVFFEKIFKQSQQDELLNIELDGLGNGFYFHPDYFDVGLVALNKLIEKFKSKFKTLKVRIALSGHNNCLIKDEFQLSIRNGNHYLINTWKDYQEYLKSLIDISSEVALRSWELIRSDYRITLTCFNNYKEMLIGKEISATQLRTLKRIFFFKQSISRKCEYLSLEFKDEIHGFIIIYEGKNKNFFAKFFINPFNLKLEDSSTTNPLYYIQYLLSHLMDKKIFRNIYLSDDFKELDLDDFRFQTESKSIIYLNSDDSIIEETDNINEVTLNF